MTSARARHARHGLPLGLVLAGILVIQAAIIVPFLYVWFSRD
jgi:hypothetical protein